MSSGSSNTSAGQNDSGPSTTSSSLQLEFDYNASWNFSYTYPISLPQILPRIDPDEDGTIVQKIAWKITEILEPICAMQHASYDEAMELGRQIQMGLDHNGAMRARLEEICAIPKELEPLLKALKEAMLLDEFLRAAEGGEDELDSDMDDAEDVAGDVDEELAVRLQAAHLHGGEGGNSQSAPGGDLEEDTEMT